MLELPSLSLTAGQLTDALRSTMKPAPRTDQVNSHACDHSSRAISQSNHQQMRKTNKIKFKQNIIKGQHAISCTFVLLIIHAVPCSATVLVYKDCSTIHPSHLDVVLIQFLMRILHERMIQVTSFYGFMLLTCRMTTCIATTHCAG